MTRVLYILFAFFFIIGNCLADVGVCDDPNTTLGETGHNCAAGKYWDSTALAGQGDCIDCPEGYYCPRQSNQNNGVAYCCPAPLVNSPEGSDEPKDCFKTVSCEADNSITADIYCNLWSDGECNFSDGTSYNVQGNFDTAHISYPREKQNYLTKNGGVRLFSTWSEHISSIAQYQEDNPEDYLNKYHLELEPHYGAPGRDSVQGWLPESYEIICKKNQLPCGTFVNATNGDYDEISASLEATNCADGTVTGNAVWDFDTETWDISQCICNRGDNQWMEDYSNNCMKKGRKIRHPKEQTPSDPITIIHSIYENVIFDTEDIIEDTSAVCRRCFPDVPNQSKYYYVPGPYGNNLGGFVDGHVTHCSSASTKGYYRPSACSGDDVDWGDGALSANPCPREKCPLGQTTTVPMPIGNNQCKFGSLTQICDSAGCINLNTVGGLSLDDWEMLP